MGYQLFVIYIFHGTSRVQTGVPFSGNEQYLHVYSSIEHEEPEKLQVTHNLHAVAATILIPPTEPEQGNDLVLTKTAQAEQFRLFYRILNVCFQF